MELLGLLERYYDTVPRAFAAVEEVGPFTLFVRTDPHGWDYYARPRLSSDHAFTARDVDAVRARQRDLGAPEQLEWVHETTPTLDEAAARSGLVVHRVPLMVLRGEPKTRGVDATVQVLGPEDPRLPAVVAAVAGGFAGTDDLGEGRYVEAQRAAAGSGHLVMAVAEVAGQVVGGGTYAPREEVAEVMGIGVMPKARRRGVGAALSAVLASDAHTRGVTTVFLSAADDAVARVYARVGFEPVGTAMIATLPERGDG